MGAAHCLGREHIGTKATAQPRSSAVVIVICWTECAADVHD